jgi:hypothetical protein
VAPNCEHQWKEDDRKWFLANPERVFRLRRLHTGELPKEFSHGETHALIRKLRPGVRDKGFLIDDTKGETLDTLPNSDAMGVVLWIAPTNLISASDRPKLIQNATELEDSPGVEITADVVFFGE